MSETHQREQEIFAQAMESNSVESALERVNVETEPGELRDRLQRLVRRHFETVGPLDMPMVDIAPALGDPAPRIAIGTQIGPYKLLQLVGEGGMGAVYMAEQKQPVERRVAIKIIKPGMDTRQVIARFEAERQALAMMDHPNIAKVLDAGTTEQGRPYFVMELVKGVPITTYCDSQHLTPRERLELFVPVCQAVQHAHQKGIIHRDLKPSNILVALYDGHPVPKVIDFGVAKAAWGRLTDKTMFTQLGQVVGTLEYMSPEQAHLNQLDVDTRSDIYSLGTVLYEILTSTTPFLGPRLRSAALDEVMRIIREEDPPAPSTRLTSSENLPSIAANRHTEPRQLSALVRGELDWIVMRALEKDRGRRYESASGLAMDIQRYLADEPVSACPPSRVYLLKKFARKNRAILSTAALVGLILVLATAFSTWQSIQSTRHAKRADQAERATRKEADKLREANVRANENLQRAREILYDFVTGFSQNRRYLAASPGAQRARLSLLEQARMHLESFLQQNRGADSALADDLVKANLYLSKIHLELGDLKQAQEFADAAISTAEQIDIAPNLSAQLYHHRGVVAYRRQKPIEAIQFYQSVLSKADRDVTGSELKLARAAALHNKSVVELKLGYADSAFRGFREALELYAQIDSRQIPRDGQLNRSVMQTNLARQAMARGKLASAESLLRNAESINGRICRDSPDFEELASELRTRSV